jgi:histidinol-phosphatase (PHP family)
MITNFHTHTHYCDGKASVSEMVNAARHFNIKQLGFSSHAPLPFPVKWSLSSEDEILKYIKEINDAKSISDGEIELYAGLETDFIPGRTKPFQFLKETYALDYIIGSVHLVKVPGIEQVWFIDGQQQFFDEGLVKYFNGDAKQAALTYFRQVKEMIMTETFDIIAHVDKIKMNNAGRFFCEEDDWYIDEILDVLDLLKEKNIILEVNTRGYYQNKTDSMYPSDFVLDHAAKKGVMMMINSDAHKPDELLLGFDEATKRLQQAGCNKTTVRRNDSWSEIAFR